MPNQSTVDNTGHTRMRSKKTKCIFEVHSVSTEYLQFWQICSRIHLSYKLILFKLIGSTFKLSQNLVSILCNKDGVLMLSRKTAIFGYNSPTISPLIPLRIAVHKYRLYGERLPHLHLIPRSVSGWRYGRIGMKMSTHSMAYEVWTDLHSMPICYTVDTLQGQQCKRPWRALISMTQEWLLVCFKTSTSGATHMGCCTYQNNEVSPEIWTEWLTIMIHKCPRNTTQGMLSEIQTSVQLNAWM